MSRNHSGAAFFDVDGTLAAVSTMFRFLQFYLAWMGRPPDECNRRYRSLRTMTRLGFSREDLNRAFFTHLAGADADTVAELAERWYRAELGTGGFYHEPALAELRRHQRVGDYVVLVSGALPTCLQAIAADLCVDEIRCTEPEIRHGRYTGALTTPPMIGAEKAAAVRSVVARRGTTASACTAYGDHASDLPMLEACGRGVVVGDDTTLRTAARIHRWRLLPAIRPGLAPCLSPTAADLSPVSTHHETPENA